MSTLGVLPVSVHLGEQNATLVIRLTHGSPEGATRRDKQRPVRPVKASSSEINATFVKSAADWMRAVATHVADGGSAAKDHIHRPWPSTCL